MFKNYLKIARFDHWIKQLFILPGIGLAVAMVSETQSIGKIMLCIVFGLLATCAAASANYVINEWLDAEFDKYHPVKKNRPCVTQGLKPVWIYIEYACFAAAALLFSYFLNPCVFITILILLIMGVFYNVKPLRTKDIPFVDVLTESVNNALRFAIGWFCITDTFLPPSSIIFGYWMGGAFLMAAKRFAEYRMIGNPTEAALYRKSFARYTELSLLLSSVFYAILSIFFCGVFLVKYKIELLLIIPFLCGLFCYYLSICFKPDSAAQKPEKLFREKKLMVFVLFIVVLFVVLYLIRIPALDVFLRTELIAL